MPVYAALKPGFEPEPIYTVSEWADRYRYLPKKGSAEPGPYRTSRTPYMREIQDSLSIYSGVQEVYVMKGTQLGMTEGGNNFFGYVVDASPGPMLMVFPTDNMAVNHSKQKLAPSIEETPRLRAKIGRVKSRDSSNTLLTKEFPGGIIYLCGANSPANFRHKSVRFLLLDDMDGYPWNVGDEGDPTELAKKRTDSFSARKKIYGNSTPTIKNLSRIESNYLQTDQRQFYVPCPKCKKKQVLVWGGHETKNRTRGLKYSLYKNGNVRSVWYECEYCHKKIFEKEKTSMLERGEWRPKYKHREKRGYHLSSLYSPVGWVSWKQIVIEFLEADRNLEKMKVWINTRMADTWDEEGSQPEWVKIKNRSEPYEMLMVPEGGLFLTAGVDVQENRLAVTVDAWGPGEETWLVYWGEIYGNPGQPAVWRQLDMLLSLNYKHESGVDLQIQTAAIDTGYYTQTVYDYCRKRPIKTIAIKGAKAPNSPVLHKPSKQDVLWNGEIIKNGVLLWNIGTDTAKATIYSRLLLTEPGPGYFHFPIGLEDEFFMQLTAEKRVRHLDKNGFIKHEWVKLRPRNEALDCKVYSYAAALRAGMVRVNWDALRRTLQDRRDGVVKGQPERERKRKSLKEKRW